jgi:hypothetical protein
MVRPRRSLYPPSVVLVVDAGPDLVYFRLRAALETPHLFDAAMRGGRVLWAIPLADLSEARMRELGAN